MKKYTLIYEDRWQVGSNHYCLTKTQRAQCVDIQDVMRSPMGQKVVYIFEGWPLMEGETEIDESKIVSYEDYNYLTKWENANK